MRQDKDRSSKWLISHHGDSILRLAGLTGFTAWRAVQPETVAPRRLPDALLEVEFPGQPAAGLVLVEIETYPDRSTDRQAFEDLLITALDRGVVPEVVCLVLHPRGQVEVSGAVERVSPQGTARLAASWRVVQLWDLRAEDLLASEDVGLVPWVPLTQSEEPAEVVLRRCREKIDRVQEPAERESLLAVTRILAGLAYNSRALLEILGGLQAVIESPVLDEAYKQVLAEGETLGRLQEAREIMADILKDRFGQVPPDCLTAVAALTDRKRLRELTSLAATCPTLDAFLVALKKPAT